MTNAIINFKDITKLDLINYFDQCQNFFNVGYNKMVLYYKGKIDSVETTYINQLDSLIKQANRVNEQFKTNREKFSTVDYWELLDFCENIREKLNTTKNLPKYLRSSRNNFSFANSFAYDYKTGNQQTLESVSKNVLRDFDSENKWVDIALKNDLLESQYDIDGGEQLKLYKEKFAGNFVTGIIDIINGETIYGKDICKKITLIDDDLFVLGYKDTVYQTVAILSTVKQGDIPEFQTLGVDSGMYVGSNFAGIAYSSIVREMKKVFFTDDLFINFKIIEMKQNQDNLSIYFSVETKYGLLIEQTTLI